MDRGCNAGVGGGGLCGRDAGRRGQVDEDLAEPARHVEAVRSESIRIVHGVGRVVVGARAGVELAEHDRELGRLAAGRRVDRRDRVGNPGAERGRTAAVVVVVVMIEQPVGRRRAGDQLVGPVAEEQIAPAPGGRLGARGHRSVDVGREALAGEPVDIGDGALDGIGPEPDHLQPLVLRERAVGTGVEIRLVEELEVLHVVVLGVNERLRIPLLPGQPAVLPVGGRVGGG